MVSAGKSLSSGNDVRVLHRELPEDSQADHHERLPQRRLRAPHAPDQDLASLTEQERKILDLMAGATRTPVPIEAVVSPEEILKVRSTVDEIYMDDKIKDYIVDVIQATRRPKEFDLELDSIIDYGASPRATLALATAARANAFMERRPYVTPQDVKSVAMDVLRHRILLTYEAEAENVSSDTVVDRILERVEVP